MSDQQEADQVEVERRWRERADAARLAREQLVCAAPHRAGQLTSAVEACAGAGAWRSCSFVSDDECPRRLERQPLEAAAGRLERARVPSDYTRTLLASFAGRTNGRGERLPPQPLRDTEALRLVQAFVAHRACHVFLDDQTPVVFRGDEKTLVLSGTNGAGKSIAAGWAIRERGGALWVNAREFAKPSDLEERANVVPLLVIDEAGEEYSGDSRYATDRLATVFGVRHADGLDTIFTTNLFRRRQEIGDAPQFAERYGRRVDDRLRERGKFVRLGGSSLRGVWNDDACCP